VLEILINGNQATRISGAAFFKRKYLTNPLVAPEDLVIASAKNLAQALKISIPKHLRVLTIQALKDLLEVFTDAAYKDFDDPAIHMPNAGAYGISKGDSHIPQHIISKGASQYGFSNGVWHNTYSRTLQCPKKIITPGSVLSGSTTENSTLTRD
jgi:hypothetical protein